MRRLAVLLPLLLLATVACGNDGDDRDQAVVLATTTSTQDSGLLVPAFEEDEGYQVKTVAVGSGQAIELGRRGEADVLLVHSPAAEQELVATGLVGERRLVMHNDFVVIGPAADPAGVAGTSTTAEAMQAISSAGAAFVSRGDESGTHTKELTLWKAAGIAEFGPWYQESGQGMGQTIQIAADRDAYTLADRGTYLATGDTSGLEVLSEGDPDLLNVYHVIDVSAEAGDRVNVGGGRAFAEWLVSDDAQAMIREFGTEEFGRPLFVPDAGKSDDEVAAGG